MLKKLLLNKTAAFLFVTLTAAFGLACSSGNATIASRPSFPPVHAMLHNGRFTIPGCPQYDRQFSKRMVVLTVPTVQEAQLAGYRPVGDCPGLQDRIAQEREAFGEMQPTPQTENWKAQLALQRNLRDVEYQQTEIEEKQQELEQKLEDAGIGE
jgi:hypothetical protein